MEDSRYKDERKQQKRPPSGRLHCFSWDYWCLLADADLHVTHADIALADVAEASPHGRVTGAGVRNAAGLSRAAVDGGISRAGLPERERAGVQLFDVEIPRAGQNGLS